MWQKLLFGHKCREGNMSWLGFIHRFADLSPHFGMMTFLEA